MSKISLKNLESETKESKKTNKFKSIVSNQDDTDNTKMFKKLLNLYTSNLTRFTKDIVPEFEVRFGTKKIKSISVIDFYNVIKSIVNNNFKLVSEKYYLKIISDDEYSNIRTEISGFPNIQNYCKFNNIANMEDKNNIKFVEKSYFANENTTIYPLDFDDFNFRLSFQTEKYYNKFDPKIENIMNKWQNTKKIYRYLKRYEYKHPELPFIIHCSIVKTSKTNKGRFVPTFTLDDADIFNSLEHYEIEIEIDNILVDSFNYNDTNLLYQDLRRVIKYVLSGLQQTNYPVSISEQNSVITNYLKLVKGKDYEITRLNNPKDFIGPSSLTLQMENMIDSANINNVNKNIPNIRNNYCVTDKADGMRKLLFINNDGKLYLINTSLNVEFTGCIMTNKDLINTLIDGEHILHDKDGSYINIFAAFDIYYINNIDIAGLPFINVKTSDKDKQTKDKTEDKTKDKNTDIIKETCRYNYLNALIKKLDIQSIIPKSNAGLEIIVKKFYAGNIFKGCSLILDNIESGLYKYNTDGLIFTPLNSGIGGTKMNKLAPKSKITWNESFKWKPPEFNTIDFLVKFQKNEYGANVINNIYNEGLNTTSSNKLSSYYTLILNVGFDEKMHGYINPCNSIINDNINNVENKEQGSGYKPARFYPTNPSDPDAGLCNIIGKLDESNNLKIYTEEGDEIEDNTIIEFKYVSSKEHNWRWVPLRVRYDKTAELRAGNKNFGNAYHVANSNWHSIHNPITDKIIRTGENIIIDNNDDDVYYNKVTNVSQTRALRDFHNLYVKSMLVSTVANPGNSLIDYACGKGGDLPKWINNNLEFVLGIDLSKDNIENRIDGACARYLNYAKKYQNILKILFLNGNSSVNIKSGDAFVSDKNKQIIKALFGEGSKNEVILGKNVYNNYGIVSNGFNISSIQFAMHYMFENDIILKEFIKNVAQCTALEGYFIGTCYDGNKVFNMLSSKNIDESISLFKNGSKIWEITKKYSSEEYFDDESCIGYAINVYQESINKTFREYLVNFKYLTRLMENYGFVLLNNDELKSLNIENSIGSFNELFNKMNGEIEKNKNFINKIGKSIEMCEAEKTISFLNNYFIFKKIRNIKNENYSTETLNTKDNKTIKDELREADKTLEKIDKSLIQLQSKQNLEEYKKEKSKEQEEIEKSKSKSKPKSNTDSVTESKVKKDKQSKKKVVNN